MLKVGHKTLVVLSGCLWLIIGFFLLSKGLELFVHLLPPYNTAGASYPLIKIFEGLTQSFNIVMFLMLLGLFVGYLKGRFVLAKSVIRVVDRILSLPNPVSLTKIYSPGYYALIGGMICLGVLMNVLKLSADIRGLIDITIGSALINGAMLYFRAAISLNEKKAKG